MQSPTVGPDCALPAAKPVVGVSAKAARAAAAISSFLMSPPDVMVAGPAGRRGERPTLSQSCSAAQGGLARRRGLRALERVRVGTDALALVELLDPAHLVVGQLEV